MKSALYIKNSDSGQSVKSADQRKSMRAKRANLKYGHDVDHCMKGKAFVEKVSRTIKNHDQAETYSSEIAKALGEGCEEKKGIISGELLRRKIMLVANWKKKRYTFHISILLTKVRLFL
ncbi:MAG: hypothetical protein PHG19_00120 [Anaerotignum sp.]|nr:hypothetical protein [Anaerotignum sp.]